MPPYGLKVPGIRKYLPHGKKSPVSADIATTKEEPPHIISSADTQNPEAAGTKESTAEKEQASLTLCDERLEQSVQESGARLIVLDPLQAYLGCDVDMYRANEVRPVIKLLCSMADRTGCAVILIGHMNKAQGLKSSYRGLGSIDF
jgi:RecA-family ATPase